MNIRNCLVSMGLAIINVIIGFSLCVLSRIDRKGTIVINCFREHYLKRYKIILDYNLRALYPSKYIAPSKFKTTTRPGELAVVIQGIIECKNDFTLETLRFYKKLFPGAHLIVSTWDFTPRDILDRFKEEGCHIVISKNFKPCGLGNVNYQICTSMAGIKKAQELGAEYILKNRSDLRLYREFTFEYLKSLLEHYPVTGNKIPLKNRIITLSGMGPQMISVNGYQDFMYFGNSDDIFNLFDIPYDNRGEDVFAGKSRKYFDIKYNGEYTAYNVCEEGTPEVYITTKFLSKYIECGMTVKDSWKYHHDYFLVVDFKILGAIWYKYKIYSLYNETEGKSAFDDRGRNYNSLTSSCILSDKLVYESWLEEERKKIVMGTKINKNWV